MRYNETEWISNQYDYWTANTNRDMAEVAALFADLAVQPNTHDPDDVRALARLAFRFALRAMVLRTPTITRAMHVHIGPTTAEHIADGSVRLIYDAQRWTVEAIGTEHIYFRAEDNTAPFAVRMEMRQTAPRRSRHSANWLTATMRAHSGR